MAECAKSLAVAAYLVDPSNPLSAGIDEHLADCSSCMTLMGHLLAIEEGLSMEYEFEDPEHPVSEKLLAYRRDEALSPADRLAIENHIASCAQCEAELSALSGFDFVQAAALARSGRPSEASVTETSDSGSTWSRVQTWIGAVDGLMSGPAYALALLLILVPIAVYTVGNLGEETGDSTPNLAVNNRVTEGGFEVGSGQPPIVPAPNEDLERRETSDVRRVEALVDLNGRGDNENGGTAGLPLGIDESPKQLALRDPPPTEVAAAGDSSLDSQNERPTDEVTLLASLDQWSIPQYQAPSDVDYFDASPILVRGGAVAIEATPRVLGPEHVALTIRESPALYWFMDRESTAGVEITLVRQGSGDVVLEVYEPGPTVQGLHALSLESHSVGLELGAEYRLYVSLVLDPKRRSRDRRGMGALRRVAEPADLLQTTRDSESRGHAYAGLGLWVDAAQFFVEISENSPDSEAARTLRDRFLNTGDAQPAN